MPTLSPTDLDAILTLQLAVAFAGEDVPRSPRLGWWQTDLVDELAGHDVLERLLPLTWRWAALEGAREAARRVDAERVRSLGRAENAITLFRFGFEVDEQLSDRLRAHKRSQVAPVDALPHLRGLVTDQPEDWTTERFVAWLEGTGSATPFTDAPAGRQIAGAPPTSPRIRAQRLATALLPLPTGAYPCPHYRLDR